MGESEEPKRRRVVAESLGWLTESTILPKKHRAIEGVGASSIVELKAQLYLSQEEAKKDKELSGAEYHRAKAKISSLPDSFSVKNVGVESRDLKDKLELKAINDGANSYAALEKKAELYEKLARGEISDEEENEKYCVDFSRKTIDEDHFKDPRAEETKDEEDNDDTPDSRFLGPGRTGGALDNEERKRLVKEVHAEVNMARERVSEVKQRRQEQAAANRERLRKAYLKKKLEKIKAANGTKMSSS